MGSTNVRSLTSEEIKSVGIHRTNSTLKRKSTMINTGSQIETRNLKTSIVSPVAGLIMLTTSILGIAFGSALASASAPEYLTTTVNSSDQVLKISEDSFHLDLPMISPESNLHPPLVDPDLQKVQH